MEHTTARRTRPAEPDHRLLVGGATQTRGWGLAFLGLAGSGVVLGGIAAVAGAEKVAAAVWTLTTLVGLAPATWWVAVSLYRHRVGVDAIAVLSLAGTLLVGEPLAGAVITLMLASGRALEALAAGRARRELTALVAHVPTTTHRREGDEIVDLPVDVVDPGDLLVIVPGEVVPVDGVIRGDAALLDESLLTGEPMPVERADGDVVRSGTTNAGSLFELRATARAETSTYAAVVRLVQQASASTAPFVRLADRFAGAFLLFTLVLAAAAWALSGELVRAVAVLVVATPCPLLLAVPVAVVAGLSRAAKRGIVIKGGGPLERVAKAKVVLLDKTGTLTAGKPVVRDVVAAGDLDADDVLRMAGSLDQVSSHVLAAAIVRAARDRGLRLSLPVQVHDVAGQGLRAVLDGHTVAVGKATWVSSQPAAPWVLALKRRAELDGSLTVFVGRDDVAIGALVLEDPVRLDARATVRALRRQGLDRIVMVTGDRRDVGEGVGAAIGVDEVYADRSPGDKVDVVRLEQRLGPTMMVGDGINDAAALAVADVGVAMGARGATVASEAADLVIVVDRLDRLAEAVGISRRALRIALQSVVVGMGLASLAMVIASFGWLPPVWGALLQELIDVAVIANALRALGGGHPASLRPPDLALTERFSQEHAVLLPRVAQLREAADVLASGDRRKGLAAAHQVHAFLVDELLPHEWAEDRTLYPVLGRSLGETEALATLSREHVEIAYLVRRLGRLLDAAGGRAEDVNVPELCGVLYGLAAVLRLHFAQEDERYDAASADQVEPASSRSSATNPRSVQVRG